MELVKTYFKFEDEVDQDESVKTFFRLKKFWKKNWFFYLHHKSNFRLIYANYITYLLTIEYVNIHIVEYIALSMCNKDCVRPIF